MKEEFEIFIKGKLYRSKANVVVECTETSDNSRRIFHGEVVLPNDACAHAMGYKSHSWSKECFEEEAEPEGQKIRISLASLGLNTFVGI